MSWPPSDTRSSCFTERRKACSVESMGLDTPQLPAPRELPTLRTAPRRHQEGGRWPRRASADGRMVRPRRWLHDAASEARRHRRKRALATFNALDVESVRARLDSGTLSLVARCARV